MLKVNIMFCPACAYRLGGGERCVRCGLAVPPELRAVVGMRDAPTTGGEMAPDTRIGTLLEGRYRILSSLGHGGMGDVYRAVDIRLTRDVAVKFLSLRLCDDASATQRFLREAQALAKLHHPNVLMIHSAGEEDGTPYLVLQLVEGRDVGSVLRAAGKLDWRTAAEVGLQACAALAHIHARGFVHRDVKPSNIMLTPEGRALLLDFGVLRDLSSDSTQTSIGVGTAAYMAPEQASDPRGVEPRSDLYALGCTLYEMIAGARPFGAPTAVEMLLRHRNDPVPKLRGSVSDVPHELESILTRAMAKRPEDRFQNALEMASALSEILGSDAARTALTVLSSPGIAALGARGRRLRPLAWLTGGVALGALAGAAIVGSLAADPPFAATQDTLATPPASAVRRDVPTPLPKQQASGEKRALSISTIVDIPKPPAIARTERPDPSGARERSTEDGADEDEAPKARPARRIRPAAIAPPFARYRAGLDGRALGFAHATSDRAPR
jgi:serine/threonine-protein kinase